MENIYQTQFSLVTEKAGVLTFRRRIRFGLLVIVLALVGMRYLLEITNSDYGIPLVLIYWIANITIAYAIHLALNRQTVVVDSQKGQITYRGKSQ